jgi:hypothetical protein
VKHGLLLREELRLRVYIKRSLRHTFGPKKDENRELIRLHILELYS